MNLNTIERIDCVLRAIKIIEYRKEMNEESNDSKDLPAEDVSLCDLRRSSPESITGNCSNYTSDVDNNQELPRANRTSSLPAKRGRKRKQLKEHDGGLNQELVTAIMTPFLQSKRDRKRKKPRDYDDLNQNISGSSRTAGKECDLQDDDDFLQDIPTSNNSEDCDAREYEAYRKALYEAGKHDPTTPHRKPYVLIKIYGVSIEESNFTYKASWDGYKNQSWEPEACYYMSNFAVLNEFHEKHKEKIREAVLIEASDRGEDGYSDKTVAHIKNDLSGIEYEVVWTDGTTNWASCWEVWSAHKGIAEFRAYRFMNKTHDEAIGNVQKRTIGTVREDRAILFMEKTERKGGRPKKSLSNTTPSLPATMMPTPGHELQDTATISSDERVKEIRLIYEKSILKFPGIVQVADGRRETYEELLSRFIKAIEKQKAVNGPKHILMEVMYSAEENPTSVFIPVNPTTKRIADSVLLKSYSPMRAAVLVGHEELVRLLLWVGCPGNSTGGAAWMQPSTSTFIPTTPASVKRLHDTAPPSFEELGKQISLVYEKNILKFPGMLEVAGGCRETFEAFSSRFFEAVEKRRLVNGGKLIMMEVLYSVEGLPVSVFFSVDPTTHEGADSVIIKRYSPLHAAVIVGHEELVCLLLRLGCTVDTVRIRSTVDKDIQNFTPLELAYSLRKQNIVKILLKAGADIQTIFRKAQWNNAVNDQQKCTRDLLDEEVVEHKFRFERSITVIQPPPPRTMLLKTFTASFNDGMEFGFQFEVARNELSDTTFFLTFAAFGPVKDCNLCSVRCNEVRTEKISRNLYKCIKVKENNIVKFMMESGEKCGRNWIAAQVHVQRFL